MKAEVMLMQFSIIKTGLSLLSARQFPTMMIIMKMLLLTAISETKYKIRNL